MLTPIDIQSKAFKGGLGYDRKDVDNFIAQIVEHYENLYKENQDLNRRIENLNSTLSQYKTIEKSLQKALLLAQKTSEDIKNQAHAAAKVIKDEARNKANLIVFDAKNELEKIHKNTVALMQQYDLYKAQFEQLAMTQIQMLKSESFNIKLSDMTTFKKTSNHSNSSDTKTPEENEPNTENAE